MKTIVIKCPVCVKFAKKESSVAILIGESLNLLQCLCCDTVLKVEYNKKEKMAAGQDFNGSRDSYSQGSFLKLIKN